MPCNYINFADKYLIIGEKCIKHTIDGQNRAENKTSHFREWRVNSSETDSFCVFGKWWQSTPWVVLPNVA